MHCSTWFQAWCDVYKIMRRLPVPVLSSAHLARYDVCEQDGYGGESDNTHAVSPVPNPMYPLPISGTFCDATIQGNQEKDGCDRSKKPDRSRCKQDSETRRVPTKPGLNTE